MVSIGNWLPRRSIFSNQNAADTRLAYPAFALLGKPAVAPDILYVYGHAASWPVVFCSSAGTFTAQSGWAMGQRGWKLHPFGLFSGEGISPLSAMRSALRTRGSGCGTAESNARE